MYAVETFGKIILAEKDTPVEMKTIKPTAAIGGVAGGEKFLHKVVFRVLIYLHTKGIFFKYATDRILYLEEDSPVWMYGGSEPNHEVFILYYSNTTERDESCRK